jgi:hypothetical protein
MLSSAMVLDEAGASESGIKALFRIRSQLSTRDACMGMLGSKAETTYLARAEGDYDIIALADFDDLCHLSSFLRTVYGITGLSNCFVVRVVEEVKRRISG